MFLIRIRQSEEHLPAADVLQLLRRIVGTRDERSGERGAAVQAGQFADRMTPQSRLFRAVRHQRLVAGDDYLPPRADPGHCLGEVVGKFNADALLNRLLQPSREFAVIPLGVALHTRAGQFLGKRVHHHQQDRLRPALRRFAQETASGQQQRQD